VRFRAHIDGAARGNPGPAGAGVYVHAEDGLPAEEHFEALGHATNNVAEYRALIARLEAAAATPARAVKVRGDSKLVIEQVAGRWKVKQEHLRPLQARARELLRDYEAVDLAHVRREFNSDADALVNAALDLP